MITAVLDNERIDEIGFGNLKLIQKPEEFCYGVDAVILSHFASINSSCNLPGKKTQEKSNSDRRKKGIDRLPEKDHLPLKEALRDILCFDLGTGTGVIPLILSYKTDWKKIVGIEVQKDSFDRANRTLQLNDTTESDGLQMQSQLNNINKFDDSITQSQLDDENAGTSEFVQSTEKCNKSTDLLMNRISFINDDVINFESWGKEYKGRCDVITSNPPYFENSGGLKNDNNPKNIARHETTAGLEDFIRAAAYLLKSRGDFFMVHRPSRLVDICEYGRRYKLEPKEIQFIAPKPDEEANIILVHFVKNGGKQLKILKTLTVHNEDGSYTEELKENYR